MKTFRITLLSAVALCFISTANGGALFPIVVDGGPYDGQEDFVTLSFNNLSSSSVTDGVLDNGDTIFGLGNFAAVGSASPPAPATPVTGPFAAFVFSGTVINAINNPIGPQIVSGAGQLTSNGDLGTLFPTLDSVTPFGSSFAALLTSQTDIFSSALSLSEIDMGAVNVEALFDLDGDNFFTSVGNVVTDTVTNLNPEISLTMTSNTIPPLNFLPVDGDNLFGREVIIRGQPDTGFLAISSAGAVTGQQLGQMNPVPEPSTVVTMLGCLAGVGFLQRRRNRKKA